MAMAVAKMQFSLAARAITRWQAYVGELLVIVAACHDPLEENGEGAAMEGVAQRQDLVDE